MTTIVFDTPIINGSFVFDAQDATYVLDQKTTTNSVSGADKIPLQTLFSNKSKDKKLKEIVNIQDNEIIDIILTMLNTKII